VTIAFRTGEDATSDQHFTGLVTQITFSDAQYQWHSREENSYADPDGPPLRSEIAAGAGTRYDIPKASIVVLRGEAK
jgi:hypothetical protein